MHNRIIYKVGQRLHSDSRLTYVRDAEPYISTSGRKSRRASFKCDCGVLTRAIINDVKRGKSLSCGCFRVEGLSTHGMTYDPLYQVWNGMIQRCTNPNDKDFKNYGARGITVCAEWMSIKTFCFDMGARPSNDHTIDRKNNDDGYSPFNCRWATVKEQARNKRNNVNLEFQGKTMCLSDWAEHLGINRDTLFNRVQRHGWSINRALSAPVRNKHAH